MPTSKIKLDPQTDYYDGVRSTVLDEQASAPEGDVANKGQVFLGENGLVIFRDESGNEVVLNPSFDLDHPTGFVDRTASTMSFVDGTRVFSIDPTASSFDIYSEGQKFSKTGDSSCDTTIPDTNGMHYIYFDSTGTLQNSTSAPTVPSNNVTAALIYWDGTNGLIIEERHAAGRNQEWHHWAHHTIGTRYETGLVGTFTSSTISITAGEIYDEDIGLDIGTETTARIWYRVAGGSEMGFDNTPANIAAKVDAGNLQYDNAGTLTNATVARYVSNWVYATPEIDTPIYTVVGQAQYTSLEDARADTLPTFPNIPSDELKLIYQVIWSNQGGTPTYMEANDYRKASTLPSGGTGSVAAAGVSFAPFDTIVATNVQNAIEELNIDMKRYALLMG